jgi:hypothetical protein
MLAIMPYPGGKGGVGVFQTIINRMPPHRVYAEPFLGGGAVMRAKRPASLNIGIDKDPEAVKAVARAAIAIHGEAGFRFETGDALGFLRWYPFAGDELIYCDPPYLFDTRNSDRPRYAYELGDKAGHSALLDILTALPCMVMLSGYWSQLYADRLHDWHSIQFQAMTHGGPRTEWLWCNFPEPIALHDYGYLGVGFRERERIKRKKQRWTARLHSLPMLERRALLAAIDETWPDLHSPKPAMPQVASPSSAVCPGLHRYNRRGWNQVSPQTKRAADIAICSRDGLTKPRAKDARQ